MHLEWYGWVIVVAWTVVVAWLALWARGKIPNGDLVVWDRYSKTEEGCKYFVLSLAASRLSSGLTEWRCALLQDESGLENPFGVFFPPESECPVVIGQLVQPIWRNDKYILCPIPLKATPVHAC